MWPPLMAISSSVAKEPVANRPRPSMPLGEPFCALGEIQEETTRSSTPPTMAGLRDRAHLGQDKAPQHRQRRDPAIVIRSPVVGCRLDRDVTLCRWWTKRSASTDSPTR